MTEIKEMQLIVDTLVDALNELARLVRKVVESIVETVRAFEAATEDGRSFPGVVSTFPRLGRGH